MSKLTKKEETEEEVEEAKKKAPIVLVQRPYLDSASQSLASMLPEQVIIKDASKAKASNWDFDSNCVTPGSEFMAKAATWLHSFAQRMISSGEWSNEVIIVVSDSSVVGEGEHKIVEWIRSQRDLILKNSSFSSQSSNNSQSSNDSQTIPSSQSSQSQDWTHLIYGADADLIFLGLALHVPGVYILREGTLPKAKSSAGKGYARTRQGGVTSNKISRDTVFVSEINTNVTEMELGRLFEACGKIASVRIIAEGHGKPLNFGFVRFGSLGQPGAVSEEEMVEVEKSVAKALTLNGHKMRGRGIGVERARRPNSKTSSSSDPSSESDHVPLSEAEQLQILDKREVMAAEFMSTTGMEEESWAQSLLALSQWRLDDALMIFAQYSSSGMHFEEFVESFVIQQSINKAEADEKKDLEKKMKLNNQKSSDSSKSANSTLPSTDSSLPSTDSTLPSTSASSPIASPISAATATSSDPSNPTATAEGDAEDEEDDLAGSLFSPYVLVNLAELSACFNQRFSHVSVFADSGEPFEEALQTSVNNVIVRQPYVPTSSLSSQSTAPNDDDASSTEASAPEEVKEAAIDPVTTSAAPAPTSDESSSTEAETANAVPAIGFKSFEIGKVLDDFVLLGMVFGNDFLPSLPAQDIKTGSFNELLDDYEKVLTWEGHLAHGAEFDLTRLARILDLVAMRERKAIIKRIKMTWRYERNQKKKEDKKAKAEKDKWERSLNRALAAATNLANSNAQTDSETKSSDTPVTASSTSDIQASAPSAESTPPSAETDSTSTESALPSADSSLPKSESSLPTSDSPLPSTVEVPSSSVPSASASSPQRNQSSGRWSRSRKEGDNGEPRAPRPPRPIVQEEPIPEPSETDIVSRRVKYYIDNFPEIDFSGDATEEAKLARARRLICGAWLRTVSWVMHYYFNGCPSWSVFYPHHYAPFALDVAIYLREICEKRPIKSIDANDDSSAQESSDIIPTHRSSFTHVLFEPSAPFKPLEQLVAVLPPESVSVLPPALRPLLLDASSPLFPFIPKDLQIQKSDGISSAVAKWHGVLRLPFIPRDTLLDAVRAALPKLDLHALSRNIWGQNVAYVSVQHPLFESIRKSLSVESPASSATSPPATGGASLSSSTVPNTVLPHMPIAHLKSSPLLLAKSTDSFLRFFFDVGRP